HSASSAYFPAPQSQRVIQQSAHGESSRRPVSTKPNRIKQSKTINGSFSRFADSLPHLLEAPAQREFGGGLAVERFSSIFNTSVQFRALLSFARKRHHH